MIFNFFLDVPVYIAYTLYVITDDSIKHITKDEV